MATNVVIGANIKKTSDRIDTQGNIINPKTKQVIELNVPVYVPTPEEIARKVNPTVAPEAPQSSAIINTKKDDGMSVLEQIKQAKEHLKALEELKKIKIKEKKAELELLEQ